MPINSTSTALFSGTQISDGVFSAEWIGQDLFLQFLYTEEDPVEEVTGTDSLLNPNDWQTTTGPKRIWRFTTDRRLRAQRSNRVDVENQTERRPKTTTLRPRGRAQRASQQRCVCWWWARERTRASCGTNMYSTKKNTLRCFNSKEGVYLKIERNICWILLFYLELHLIMG